MLLRPHKLPRNITCIVAVVIYHTTSSREPENLILKDHIQRNLDNLLRKYPNAIVVITVDFNPNSTGLKQTHLALPNHLKVPMQRNFYPIFIVFLKSTAGMIKNDVSSFFISHRILKLSHILYFEL
jgi:hypothetical protein